MHTLHLELQSLAARNILSISESLNCKKKRIKSVPFFFLMKNWSICKIETKRQISDKTVIDRKCTHSQKK